MGVRSKHRKLNSHIPPEVCTEILSYLPAKTLLQFISVSKTWKSIIDNPDFASLHFKRCPSNVCESHQLVLCESVTRAGTACRWVLRRSKTLRKVSDIKYAGSNYCPFSVIGAAGGLFLMGNLMWDKLTLWNPSIRKSLCIPPPPSLTLTNPFIRFQSFQASLGFDESTNDYKVLMIVSSPSYSSSPIPLSIEIFSLKTRSWRTVVSSGIRRMREPYGHKFYFRGCIYWIGEDVRYCLV